MGCGLCNLLHFHFPTADELVLVMVRSTKAHAQIVSVDPSAALAMPGVVGYVGHQDVPGSNVCGMLKDELIFAVDKVNVHGSFQSMVCFRVTGYWVETMQLDTG